MTSDRQPRPEAKPAPLAESLPDDSAPKPRAPGRTPGPSYRAMPAPLGPEAEAKLRQANLLRVRGDVQGAIRELRAALEAEPSSAQLHEMLGDLLAQTGETTAAIESYRRAQSIGGGPALESKIGRLLAGRAGDTAGSGSDTLIRGGGAVPVVASLLVPGLGLALAGWMNAAAIAFGGWILSACLLLLVPAARAVVERPLGGEAAVSAGGVLLAVIFGAANIGFYVYSLVETMRVAKPAGKGD